MQSRNAPHEIRYFDPDKPEQRERAFVLGNNNQKKPPLGACFFTKIWSYDLLGCPPSYVKPKGLQQMQEAKIKVGYCDLQVSR